MAEFKDILKKLRSERNWSQVVLAEELHAGSSTVASWENGARMPSRANMEQLADIFNVDLAYLYGESEIRQRVSFDRDGNRMVSDTLVLSGQEKILIESFRSLNNAGREYILQTMNMALSAYKSDSDVKRA